MKSRFQAPSGGPITSTATPKRSRAAEFFGGSLGGGWAPNGKRYPTRPEGVSDAIADDIAERRSRSTTEEHNREIGCNREWDRRVKLPTGPGIYETFIKPRGLAVECGGCTCQVELDGNCPGLVAGSPTAAFVPCCHSDQPPHQRLAQEMAELMATTCLACADSVRAGGNCQGMAVKYGEQVRQPSCLTPARAIA